jgi:hypothetical protein
MNTNTYADFLLSFIQIIERNQARAIELDIPRFCFLCNILENPCVPNAREWQEKNAVYITMMQNAIIAKMKQFDRKEAKKAAKLNSRHKPVTVGTLTIPLREQYEPEKDSYTIRLLWLKDLYKYHKARGTTRYHRERRSFLKLPTVK